MAESGTIPNGDLSHKRVRYAEAHVHIKSRDIPPRSIVGEACGFDRSTASPAERGGGLLPIILLDLIPTDLSIFYYIIYIEEN